MKNKESPRNSSVNSDLKRWMLHPNVLPAQQHTGGERLGNEVMFSPANGNESITIHLIPENQHIHLLQRQHIAYLSSTPPNNNVQQHIWL